MGEDGFEERPPLFRSEQQLLDKLEVWLASRAGETTIFDVISSGDGELLAAYILKAFRTATRQAVIDHLKHHAQSTFGYEGAEVGDAAYRVFSGIADAWGLSGKERVVLLGLDDAAEPGAGSSSPWRDLSPEVLERLYILLDIFQAINTLLPIEERADAWMRKPNQAPLFKGRSAIGIILDHGVEGMRKLRSYLQSQTS